MSSGITRIPTFRPWVKKVMPTIYDDTLTYYELLTKTIGYLNQLNDQSNEIIDWMDTAIESQNISIDEVRKNFTLFRTEMNESYKSFTDDIENRVMPENIDNILSAWFDNGKLAEIINNDVFDMKADKEMVDLMFTEIEKNIDSINKDIDGRGINPRKLGAKLDGIHDDYQIIMDALATYKHVVIPIDGIIATSKPIVIGQGQSLVGASFNVRNYTFTPTIKYIGEKNDRDSLVILGKNKVGAEPTLDATNIVFKNFYVDCQKQIGFGVYGTYLTNETIVDNIVVRDSLEYNYYFARGWYATITNLTSLNCRNKGIALGMPLTYLDGTQIIWKTSAPLELNNIKIDNIRSIRCGEYYAVENPGLFNPTNNVHNIQGYGIGAGIGNGFRLTNFLSESSGGFNLYVYTSSQPSKSIKYGYLENANLNSSLADKDKGNILIEHISNQGGAYVIDDIFCNYSSGGIYFKGESRIVRIKNLHQPRFLKSLSGHTDYELYQIVLKENVYYECGYSNTNIGAGIEIARETVNTRYTWNIPIHGFGSGRIMVLMRKKSDVPPIGTYIIDNNDGTTTSLNFPELTSEWTYVRMINGSSLAMRKGGNTDEFNSDVDIRLVSMPPTFF